LLAKWLLPWIDPHIKLF